MAHRVVYTPDAEDHLAAILRFVAEGSSFETAEAFVGGLERHCDGLADFPRRGTPVGKSERGVRALVYRGRATITYMVENDTVTILGVFYAGRDWRGKFD
jgi:plasmid stabilization system protein ParE